MEPEAAAVYLSYLSFDKRIEGNEDDMLQTFTPGSTFMVVDAGGTVCVHKKK